MNGDRISRKSRVIANFLLKFTYFRYNSDRGWSGKISLAQLKFADPDNPLLGAGMGVVSPSPIQAKLSPICG